MKMNHFKKMAVALAAIGLMAAGGNANAVIATGTVTITGTAAVVCTVSSPTLDFGAAVPTGTVAQVMPLALDVSCPNAVPWSLGTTGGANTQAITVGVDTTSNVARLETLGGLAIGAANAQTGTGTGAIQTQNLRVRIGSSGGVAGLVGTGAITGALGVSLTY